MKKKIYSILVLLIFHKLLFSQDPNLVNYTSQITYGDYFNNETYVFGSTVRNLSEVDMFRGRLNVNIPIYTIKVNGFEYPISLHYGSSGFKLEQMASWIGLGWELNVPGIIKRSVQGIPDESNCGGFLGYGGNELFNLFLEGGLEDNIYDHLFADPDYWEGMDSPDGANGGAHVYGINSEENDDAYLDLRHIAENYFDGMPDIFTYKTGRQSGKFVFDRKGNIHQIPKSNNQIFFTNPTTNQAGDWSNSSFTIVDENGIKYIYNLIDIMQPYPEWSIKPQYQYKPAGFIQSRSEGTHISYTEEGYVSAWHLEKIIFPNNQEILFNYESDNTLYYSSINESYFNSTRLYDGAVSDPYDPDIYVKINRSFHKINETRNRITSIEWNGNTIQFNKSTEKREDMNDNPSLNGYALDNIIIRDANNQIIKQIKLNHSYFEQQHGSYWGEASWKRLKLDNITEINKNGESLPPYSFSYIETDQNGYSVDLPSYFSHHRDIWGYYKYLSGSYNLRISKPKYYMYPDDGANPLFNSIYSIYPRTSHQGECHIIDGYDMTPDFSGVSIYLLQKINYPTGGSDIIEYELNKFRYDGQDVSGPGTRVKKIHKNFSSDNQINNLITTTYKYSNADTTTGLVAALPEIFKFDEGLYNNAPINHINPNSNRLKWATSVYAEVRNQADTEVGYKKVTKEFINKQDASQNYQSVYHFDFSGNYYQYEDVYHTELDDYIYKKPKSLIWLEDQITGYWPLTQEWVFLTDNKIRDRHPDLLTPDFDWYRGSLLKEEHYNNENELIQSVDYNYQLGTDIDQIFGMRAYTYFLFDIPEDDVIGILVLPGGGEVYIYSPGLEYRKLRWGAQCYTSVFKNLESKTITSYFNGQQLIDQYTYSYSENLPHYNKSKINNIKQELSNGQSKQTVYKYTNDYSDADCFVDYEADRASAYDQYITNLEQNCLNADVCYDFEYSGSEDCIDCIKDEYSSYLQNLLTVFQNYQQCLDNQVSNSDNYASSLLQLSAKNQLQLVEQQEQIIDNNITYQLFGNFTLFDTYPSDQILPAISLSAEFIQPQNPNETLINSQGELIYSDYEVKNYYDEYDAHGNPLQHHEADNINITYLFGYNYSYPIAKIENSTYSEVEANIGCTYEQLQEKTGTELMTVFDNLRTALSNAFITSYTFISLVGLETETDPSGITTYYYYDSFNRLETIKDHNGNIIKHIDYHYKDE